jgi:shikimate dehydrogenase
VKISGTTRVAAVVGAPVAHSLSPLIHNAWIASAGLDAVYVALEPRALADLVAGLRGGVVRGLNVTAPFKAEALALADTASTRARAAGAANLLVFEEDGRVTADNTDGAGLLAAFAEQAPGFDPAAGPVAILGAGGAARGAAAAFVAAGAPAVRILARSPDKARKLADDFAPAATGHALDDRGALVDVIAVINAIPAAPRVALALAPSTAVVMDMVYRPLVTPLLAEARTRGLQTVDGLAMLIGQARPSFEALFGVAPPAIDVRALALEALERVA